MKMGTLLIMLMKRKLKKNPWKVLSNVQSMPNNLLSNF